MGERGEKQLGSDEHIAGLATEASVRVLAIVQARMTSSRLPGKMMMKLAGRPLIYHILERALAIQKVDKIVLATTTNETDDILVEVASSMGIASVRGSEKNVASRFQQAMDQYHPEIIVRITGDAPLFDPAYIDASIEKLKEEHTDLVEHVPEGPSAYQGASVISASALRRSFAEAPDDPLVYEHVDAYARQHRKNFKVSQLQIDPEMLGDHKLSIDTEDDLKKMQDIYDALYVPGSIVSLRDAVKYIRGKQT